MALRNKTLAVTMILNGWHPIDAYRMMETDVTDVPDYRDRSGHHRPKIIFAGEETHHTKVHSIKVRNTIGCGCQSNHDPRDVRCFYNIVKEYIVEKDKSDEMFMRDCYPRLSKAARLFHTFICVFSNLPISEISYLKEKFSKFSKNVFRKKTEKFSYLK